MAQVGPCFALEDKRSLNKLHPLLVCPSLADDASPSLLHTRGRPSEFQKHKFNKPGLSASMEFESLDSPVADEFVRIIGSSLDPSDKDAEEQLEGSDHSEVEARIPISHAYEQAASYIADFRATRQNIIRATPCYKALSGFGRAFRFRKASDYHKSFPTDTIQEFWSHSWHGSTPRKISTVMVQKNGLAAISAGTLASLLLVCLFVAGYLPGYERAPFQKTGRDSYLFGIWGMVGGTLVAMVTLIGWQCRTPVFVDVICIHQFDPGLKAEALLSMGAFLQSSESLHVWWDETFVERQGRSGQVEGFNEEPGNGEGFRSLSCVSPYAHVLSMLAL